MTSIDEKLRAELARESIENEDPIGTETLRRIYKLNRLNQWMWSRVEPWVGQRVVEAGCGTGNMTAFLLDREAVFAVDMNQKHLDALQSKYSNADNLTPFCSNLEDVRLRELSNQNVDTIVCLNVLEHVEKHEETLSHFEAILRPGGHLVLLVPAFQSLYGTLDAGLSHYRRYGKTELLDLLTRHGLKPISHRYLNMVGILGWWLNGKVLKREILPTGQLNLYNRLVPFFMTLEDITGPPCGLSHVVCARKEG